MSSPKERRRHLSPVLLAVDTSPALQLHPRPHSIESPEATPGARDPTSPASTPSAAPSPFNIVSTPSKEQGSAIATPADSDASAHLTYAANEAWSIVLPKALDVAQTALCINYALSSGFLIKRSGPNAHDPPVLLGVSVMYISTSGEEQQDSTNGALSQPHTKHKRLLKQIIAMYRKLAVLAEIRGLQDETKTLPWHVAVAEKGAAALIALS
ncbi:MAG: mediator of RNA polymerase II transcription subunit 13 [Chrysothrix sp. TS-e1954]|nr:MAG: mediator of RNA polymerase II transcription subunit 13 [Chrysothrix sp. TS-e1954]